MEITPGWLAFRISCNSNGQTVGHHLDVDLPRRRLHGCDASKQRPPSPEALVTQQAPSRTPTPPHARHSHSLRLVGRHVPASSRQRNGYPHLYIIEIYTRHSPPRTWFLHVRQAFPSPFELCPLFMYMHVYGGQILKSIHTWYIFLYTFRSLGAVPTVDARMY